ncbi:hypothetical protein ABZ234_03725 [Nocardiopsis sp. NPDC006198]|uniref:hypothetical protein n=1 Tax=Nocardiopsis sp. NPDC006198 TaxID=3154472 RepID=UPI0033A1634A
MYVYRNSNTGDEVGYERRSARLDNLPNWVLVSSPADPPPVVGPDRGPAMEDMVSTPDALTAQPERPKQSDDKATWIAYIASTTDLSEAEAKDLTKAELIAQADE